MELSTLLLRQVHPAFVQNNRVSELVFTTQVFTPTKKDKDRLSTYNNEKFKAQEAYAHYTQDMDLDSVGVVAVSCSECEAESLAYGEDNDPFDGHCYIDYDGLSSNKKKSKSKILKRYAMQRGWLYQST